LIFSALQERVLRAASIVLLRVVGMRNVFFLMLIGLVLSCCVSQTVEQLNGTEIKDYQGEKLGSVSDFRENSIKGPQNISIDSYRLEVTGLVDNPKTYTYAEALNRKAYAKVIQIDCVEGWSVKALWEGILVRDLIDESKAKPQANTVIFYAYDGYTTSLPLQYVRDNDILLAYKINNVTLPIQNGYPFQLAAEQKWGYKWIRWVTKIELSEDSNYKGYWESRGYNNNGDQSGPMFG
jgi:DMSO/TMAO reductase YedYZ molybdopterin-dependent catalytic subunit